VLKEELRLRIFRNRLKELELRSFGRNCRTRSIRIRSTRNHRTRSLNSHSRRTPSRSRHDDGGRDSVRHRRSRHNHDVLGPLPEERRMPRLRRPRRVV
jgi:hypothetical protein